MRLSRLMCGEAEDDTTNCFGRILILQLKSTHHGDARKTNITFDSNKRDVESYVVSVRDVPIG